MPKLKKRKIQPLNTSNEETDDKETVITSTSDDDDDESGDTAEDLSDEEAENTNTDSGEDEEEEDEDEEEEDDNEEEKEEGKDEGDKDEEDKNENNKDEDNKDEDNEDEEEKKFVPKRKLRLSDFLDKKKGKIVTMDYCTKHLYKGPIQNIKDMLNGSAKEEIEIKEETPDKNDPAFRNAPKKWGWKQEVMLLEGIEANGLNWELIAEQLSKQSRKKFKPDEVKNHYFQYYYNGTLGQVWDYQLEEKPLEHFDHTDPIVVNVKKYLPQVAVQHLKEIKFLPHREDFENYLPEEIELMLTHVDFSAYYINNLKSLKIDQEVRNLQLVIVDAYRTIVTERMKMYKLMQDFKLIEQFFFNMQNKNFKKCEIDKHFTALQKFIRFFDSPNEFINFYVDCVREKLLKMEIARLCQVLATKRNKERDPEVKTMLKKRAPCSFSMLTKILYCTRLKRERKNSNSQKGREHDEVFIYALPTILEGLKLRCERMK